MTLSLMLFAALLVAPPAEAGARQRRDLATERQNQGPTASAAEIPALAKLLEKAGWTPTPELSGVFRAGYIFAVDGRAHTVLGTDCIEAAPHENTYSSTELVTSLHAGVSVGGPLVSARVTSDLVKRVRFDTPVHVTVPTLELALTDRCTAQLSTQRPEVLSGAYVVQEVLRAQITEQTCGRLDASGRFVGMASAESELARACSLEALEPVAVGYRTVPLSSLMPTDRPTAVITPAAAALPAPPPDGCPHAREVHLSQRLFSKHTLSVDAAEYPLNNRTQRAALIERLGACTEPALARSLSRWRSRKVAGLTPRSAG